MWKGFTANHIRKAHARYNAEKPTRKEVMTFLNNLDFSQPFLRCFDPNINKFRYIRVHIWPFESNCKKPEAAVPVTKNCIFMNPEWAAKIFYYRPKNIELATVEQLQRAAEGEDDLLFTLGHEMSHVTLDRGCDSFFTPRRRKRFINWVNEVHADFVGATSALNGDRKRAVASMNRKQALRKKDKDTVYHPNWEKRIDYMENYNFDEKLIRRIAKDAGCNEKHMINKVLKWYGFQPIEFINPSKPVW